MDKSRILSLLNQIEMIIVTICNTGYTIQPGDEEAILNRTKAIADEVNAPPKSNADFIRHMTDEELSEFLGNVIDHCNFLDCENCPMERACTDVPLSRDKWLRHEVHDNE